MSHTRKGRRVIGLPEGTKDEAKHWHWLGPVRGPMVCVLQIGSVSNLLLSAPCLKGRQTSKEPSLVRHVWTAEGLHPTFRNLCLPDNAFFVGCPLYGPVLRELVDSRKPGCDTVKGLGDLEGKNSPFGLASTRHDDLSRICGRLSAWLSHERCRCHCRGMGP